MKLYVQDKISGEKTYLKQNASSRQELLRKIGTQRFKIGGKIYSVEDVKAESNDNIASAMAAGGVIGVIGGVPGVVLGGIIGALLGKNTDEEDRKKANFFNSTPSEIDEKSNE